MEFWIFLSAVYVIWRIEYIAEDYMNRRWPLKKKEKPHEPDTDQSRPDQTSEAPQSRQ